MNTISELIGRIKQRQQEISESVVNGNCVNFESYQRLVGQNIGLAEALEILETIIEEQNRDVE